jgi:capsular polysaccharide biosynthesis protein
MAAAMRAHFGMPPLQHVNTGSRSRDAEAFAREHETIPGAPFLLFVERSIGDPRALRNADELVSALAQFANVARVRFEGMKLQTQMVVSEAADVFVSVHGSDAVNLIFMRPGAVAVTVQPLFLFFKLFFSFCRRRCGRRSPLAFKPS